jgi:hypothetical protein
VTFPSTCQRIVVSTRVSETLDLNHLSNSTNHVENTCVWYSSRPSRAIFVVRTRGGARLQIESLDGRTVTDAITEGRVELEFDGSILFHWITAANSVDSFANVRFIQRDNSLPYATRIYEEFIPTARPHYFVAQTGRESVKGMEGTPAPGKGWDDQEDQEEGESEIVVVSIPGLVVLLCCVAVCGSCCWCCCRVCQGKKQNNEGAVSLGDVEDDAVPPVFDPQRGQVYYPYGYYPVQPGGN